MTNTPTTRTHGAQSPAPLMAALAELDRAASVAVDNLGAADYPATAGALRSAVAEVRAAVLAALPAQAAAARAADLLTAMESAFSSGRGPSGEVGQQWIEFLRQLAASRISATVPGMEPGKEAEELRSGIEKIINEGGQTAVLIKLQALLDKVDARDSLHYVEHARTPYPADDADRTDSGMRPGERGTPYTLAEAEAYFNDPRLDSYPRELVAFLIRRIRRIDEERTKDLHVMTTQGKEIERLRSFVRSVPSATKHGPGGRGDVGPCDAACVKCEAERLIKGERSTAVRNPRMQTPLSDDQLSRAIGSSVDDWSKGGGTLFDLWCRYARIEQNTYECAIAYGAFRAARDYFSSKNRQGIDPDARKEIAALKEYADLTVRRYQRLRILGCAPFGTKHLGGDGNVMRFQNLDDFLDADLKAHPHRGEAPLHAKLWDTISTAEAETANDPNRVRAEVVFDAADKMKAHETHVHAQTLITQADDAMYAARHRQSLPSHELVSLRNFHENVTERMRSISKSETTARRLNFEALLDDVLEKGGKALMEPRGLPAHRGGPATDVCSCGARHTLNEFEPESQVRTKVLAEGPGWVLPAGTIGKVQEWSQYGGPLYYRVRFHNSIDGTVIRDNFKPCEIERAP